MTVKDGSTDLGTPIVSDKKKGTEADNQLWARRHIFDTIYLVSKLGDNIQLSFQVRLTGTKFQHANNVPL